VAASSKLIIVDKILADILPKGERVIIFSVSGSSILAFCWVADVSLAMDGVILFDPSHILSVLMRSS
jgi:SWI/SNF-related matrix-associated actin-dependent regulator of chromatin subfamily A member 5